MATKVVDASPPTPKIPPEVMGPAMRALPNDRQRLFAYLIACKEKPSDAARIAGFAAEGNEANHRHQGWRLRHYPAVQAAVKEVSYHVLGGLVPAALWELGQMLKSRDVRVRCRAVEIVLDRTGFAAKTEHKVTVEHTDDGRMLLFAERLAEELGIGREKLVGPNVIEGEVVK